MPPRKHQKSIRCRKTNLFFLSSRNRDMGSSLLQSLNESVPAPWQLATLVWCCRRPTAHVLPLLRHAGPRRSRTRPIPRRPYVGSPERTFVDRLPPELRDHRHRLHERPARRAGVLRPRRPAGGLSLARALPRPEQTCLQRKPRPEILNAADGLVLMRIAFLRGDGRAASTDYFVYRTGPGEPSLHLIPGPVQRSPRPNGSASCPAPASTTSWSSLPRSLINLTPSTRSSCSRRRPSRGAPKWPGSPRTGRRPAMRWRRMSLARPSPPEGARWRGSTSAVASCSATCSARTPCCGCSSGPWRRPVMNTLLVLQFA